MSDLINDYNVPFTLTTEEYRKVFGEEESTSDSDVLQMKLNEACGNIWDYICGNSTLPWERFSQMNQITPFQIRILKKAALYETAQIVKDGGSFSNESGWNGNGFSFGEKESTEREISFKAKRLLLDNGFLYKGL